ncbi:hypothetical protein [Herbidospora sp. NBRC 101105]|uniref:hypothetical protein n=1 Tax=Herbidospora sp. NBRC 101105 TaxID=3032195 RepID=UPI0024A30EAA|nr:hypothetical protein [Herbidospora sp. NBRC 101105]GLX96195.1 hypothetical protein Hesp01_41450 [Herbidospora sp. NBRC 101105]
MQLRTRVAVMAVAAVSSVGLLAAPAQAATLLHTFAKSYAGQLYCEGVERYYENWRAEQEGHAGDWYACVGTSTAWEVWER